MEIWGLCGECGRWFHCEGWFDRSRDEPMCPGCGGPARKIVNRNAGTVVVDGAGGGVGATTALAT